MTQKYDPFFMYNSSGEEGGALFGQSLHSGVLFALAGRVAAAAPASYLGPGWLTSEPITSGRCANSAVLAEFHLRVNVRAPHVWNAPPAGCLQTWFINGFLFGLNTVRGEGVNSCCLVFFFFFLSVCRSFFMFFFMLISSLNFGFFF